MSKGLSEIQKTILGLLNGTEKGLVYRNAAGGLDTREIVEELLEREILNQNAPRKQLASTVIRACSSLVRRELIEGLYVPDANNPGRRTISWKAVCKKDPKPK